MPSVERPGKATVYAEVPADLKAAFVAYAEGIGSDLRAELEMAMRRHLAYPPAPAGVPPLPTGRRKKKGGSA
jgi:hypothetical protein